MRSKQVAQTCWEDMMVSIQIMILKFVGNKIKPIQEVIRNLVVSKLVIYSIFQDKILIHFYTTMSKILCFELRSSKEEEALFLQQ